MAKYLHLTVISILSSLREPSIRKYNFLVVLGQDKPKRPNHKMGLNSPYLLDESRVDIAWPVVGSE